MSFFFFFFFFFLSSPAPSASVRASRRFCASVEPNVTVTGIASGGWFRSPYRLSSPFPFLNLHPSRYSCHYDTDSFVKWRKFRVFPVSRRRSSGLSMNNSANACARGSCLGSFLTEGQGRGAFHEDLIRCAAGAEGNAWNLRCAAALMLEREFLALSQGNGACEEFSRRIQGRRTEPEGLVSGAAFRKRISRLTRVFQTAARRKPNRSAFRISSIFPGSPAS